jgi:thiol:disulfide interchange protein DsbC
MKRTTDIFTFYFRIVLLLLLCGTWTAAAGAPMDLNKAIRTGSGKTVVIEFTDPDCGFCRKAEELFRNRTDVTRYIFFIPLPMHPQAREKAQFILSSPDPAKAYAEAMAGKLDKGRITGITDAGRKRLDEHMAIAREAGVDSTPNFMICGRIIQGFDPQKIKSALGE